MLSKLEPNIKRTSELMQKINLAGRAQDSSVEEVNTAIQQLDTVIKTNTVLCDNISKISARFSINLNKAEKEIDFFKV